MDLRIGTSTEPDVGVAVGQAVRTALAASGSPALALVFSTFDYPVDEVATAASRELGGLPWAGMVTPAILHGQHVLPRGVAIGVIDSDRVRVSVGSGGPMSADAREAGRQAALEALAGVPRPPPTAVAR